MKNLNLTNLAVFCTTQQEKRETIALFGSILKLKCCDDDYSEFESGALVREFPCVFCRTYSAYALDACTKNSRSIKDKTLIDFKEFCKRFKMKYKMPKQPKWKNAWKES